MTTPGEPTTSPPRQPEVGQPEAGRSAARLAHFPVTFFAVVMGVAGLSLAWSRAGLVLGGPEWVGVGVFWLAVGLEVVVLAAYGLKLVRHPDAVRREMQHPVRLAFVPTATIALLLLATAGQDVVPGVARVLWWVGAAGQLVATLAVVSAWIARPTFAGQHVNPAWFIPVVGLVVVPLAGVRFGPPEISSFFFSVGVLFWLALLPIVLSRLFVHEHPLPDQLLPTLAVLIAPPSVAFLSWRLLQGGEVDRLAEGFAHVAVFFALVFFAQVGRLRRIPFFLSWWAYSFPLAALSVAVTVWSATTPVLTGVAWALLGGVTVVVAVLIARTAAAVAGGRICVPE